MAWTKMPVQRKPKGWALRPKVSCNSRPNSSSSRTGAPSSSSEYRLQGILASRMQLQEETEENKQ
ncbi:hypothetical protein BRADI_2g62591v3 [Brachypodium distachyon]|uniref:Uncharacterized protein n=1 Tax=Brachypodium distachyon TaxID=15368 RepID=A0A0Q3GMY1_BRADI|nr:hypothetical protein BRADI_2g62591v3 [Brachypodium distachyon]